MRTFGGQRRICSNWQTERDALPRADREGYAPSGRQTGICSLRIRSFGQTEGCALRANKEDTLPRADRGIRSLRQTKRDMLPQAESEGCASSVR